MRQKNTVILLLLLVGGFSGSAKEPATAQVLQFSPSPVNFGNVTITHKRFAPITISNPGPDDFEVGTILINNQAPGAFFINADGCGTTIAAGASCKVQVGYTPPYLGRAYARLIVASSTGQGYSYDELSGRGVN